MAQMALYVHWTKPGGQLNATESVKEPLSLGNTLQKPTRLPAGVILSDQTECPKGPLHFHCNYNSSWDHPPIPDGT